MDTTPTTAPPPTREKIEGGSTTSVPLDSIRGFAVEEIATQLARSKKLHDFVVTESQFGLTEKIDFPSRRSFVLHTPIGHDPKREVPLLLFLHGAREDAVNCAVEDTRWIERTNSGEPFAIAFCQAGGMRKDGEFAYVHPTFGDVSFGELYWEIRDGQEGFEQDLRYIEQVLERVQGMLTLKQDEIYVMGHSNGGVFVLLLLLYVPGRFAAACSHMGGIGWDPFFYLDFSLLHASDVRTPLLIVTAENDSYRHPCEAAEEIFQGEGFPVDLIMMREREHRYYPDIEPVLWAWFQKNKRDRKHE